MLAAMRHAIVNRAGVVVESIGLLVSLSGALLAVAFGRALLALALGAVVLGFFFRLTGRRRARISKTPAPPAWPYAASAFLSVVEVGVLVEATSLPVRFYQEGFALYHWALVLIALLAAFWLQLAFFRVLTARREASR